MNELKKIKIIDLKNYQEVVENFSCKAKEIDDYLKKKAYMDMSKIKSVTYLLFKNNELFGFYTLNIYQIEGEKPNDDGDIESFNYLELKYLGVDVKYQNKGIGSEIMEKIIIPEAREYFNFLNLVKGLCIIPLNDKARNFYSKFGFKTLKFDIYNGEEIEYLWIDFLSKK
ncbi:GNAT family N-acetyltransferase [Leptotrichia buccalis]|jgi:toxin-antitoxin system, toxin component, GNAT family